MLHLEARFALIEWTERGARHVRDLWAGIVWQLAVGFSLALVDGAGCSLTAL